MVLDIDGVIDRRVFGFPCTSAAGIEALALLHAHERSIALDTARSAVEVREYCSAYGLVGGVAEYGSYVWDAVEGRGRTLVSPESLGQLESAGGKRSERFRASSSMIAMTTPSGPAFTRR